MAKKTVKDLDLKGKKVLVRADFNVPMKDGKITNDNRIQAALPTLEYVLDQGGKAIVFSHLGRVKTEEDKAGLSMKPVSERLSELLGKDVTFVAETRGEELETAVNNLNDGEIMMFETTVFYYVDVNK
jgi:phosphoglycerate kinase